jgi:ABC-type phosphate transport system permease subunit
MNLIVGAIVQFATRALARVPAAIFTCFGHFFLFVRLLKRRKSLVENLFCLCLSMLFFENA